MLIYNSDLDTNVATLETKKGLKTEKDIVVKVEAFDSICFRGKSHFEDDRSQNCLVFEPVYRSIKKIAKSDHNLV